MVTLDGQIKWSQMELVRAITHTGFAQSLTIPRKMTLVLENSLNSKKVQFVLELSLNFEKISLIITKSP